MKETIGIVILCLFVLFVFAPEHLGEAAGKVVAAYRAAMGASE